MNQLGTHNNVDFIPDSQLQAVQQKALELLAFIVDYCENNNIVYYLGFGTLLGAVRHNGFIPWDDDIDVLMPRADYERFIQNVAAALPAHFFLQNYNTDPWFWTDSSKLRNSDTTFIEESVAHLDINHGIFVDIFPLDGAKDEKTFRRRLAQLSRYQYWIRVFDRTPLPHPTRFDRFAAGLFRWATKKLTNAQLVAASDKVRSKESLENCPYCFAFYADILYPVALFGQGKRLPFENLNCRVPDDAEAYLALQYGDYMQLPPYEERRAPHSAAKIDTKRSYKAYRR